MKLEDLNFDGKTIIMRDILFGKLLSKKDECYIFDIDINFCGSKLLRTILRYDTKNETFDTRYIIMEEIALDPKLVLECENIERDLYFLNEIRIYVSNCAISKGSLKIWLSRYPKESNYNIKERIIELAEIVDDNSSKLIKYKDQIRNGNKISTKLKRECNINSLAPCVIENFKNFIILMIKTSILSNNIMLVKILPSVDSFEDLYGECLLPESNIEIRLKHDKFNEIDYQLIESNQIENYECFNGITLDMIFGSNYAKEIFFIYAELFKMGYGHTETEIIELENNKILYKETISL